MVNFRYISLQLKQDTTEKNEAHELWALGESPEDKP